MSLCFTTWPSLAISGRSNFLLKKRLNFMATLTYLEMMEETAKNN